MLGSHCRAIYYARHDWPLAADRGTVTFGAALPFPFLPLVPLGCILSKAPDRYGSWEIAVHPIELYVFVLSKVDPGNHYFKVKLDAICRALIRSDAMITFDN